MNWILSIILILAGFLCLVKGADWFVDGASGLAKKWGVSALVIGLTIVAFGTSAPELAVSMTAALEGANEIAVGNVVGSNIFNLLVVAGLSACIYPLVIDPVLLKRDWPLSNIAALVLTLMLLGDQTITRWEGFLLLVLFAGMLVKQLSKAKKEKDKESKPEVRSYPVLFLLLMAGIITIVIGGKLAVEGATRLAVLLGWSQTLIGLTIVAIGTSLPELMTSIIAARKGENEIAMGNVIGSNLFNILCILGLSSVVHPITVQPTAIYDSLILMGVSTLYWILAKRFQLDRKLGICMIFTYILYTIYIVFR